MLDMMGVCHVPYFDPTSDPTSADILPMFSNVFQCLPTFSLFLFVPDTLPQLNSVLDDPYKDICVDFLDLYIWQKNVQQYLFINLMYTTYNL